jgi:hypothetical protein
LKKLSKHRGGIVDAFQEGTMRNESGRPSVLSTSIVALGAFGIVSLAAAGAGAQPAPPGPTAPAPGDATAADPPTGAADAPAAADAPTGPPAAAPTPTPAAAVTGAPPPAAEAPASYPSMGKAGELKLSDAVWFRFGVQAQTWANFQQSPTVQANGHDGGFSRDLYFRRARVLVGAQLAKIGDAGYVGAFLNLESSNLGKAAAGPPDADMNPTAVKTDGTVKVFDAFGEVKLRNELAIDAGLMLIPLSRNILQSTVTYLGLDFGATTGVVAGTTVGNTGRDLGFQLKGQFLAGALEYRAGVFQGVRAPAVPGEQVLSENPFRFTGYLQYNVFEPEAGYVFNGTYFGKKKVLGVGVGADLQPADSGDPYTAYSGSLFAALPIAGASPTGGDEIAGLVQYIHYDGNDAIATMGEQNDLLAELAYYSKALNVSVFGKAEAQLFVDDALMSAGAAGNKVWFGGGLKYYLAEARANFTLAYTRVQFPEADTATVNPTNQLTLQMQLFYF